MASIPRPGGKHRNRFVPRSARIVGGALSCGATLLLVGCEVLSIGPNVPTVQTGRINDIRPAPERQGAPGVLVGEPGGVRVFYFVDNTQPFAPLIATPQPVLGTGVADIDRDGDEDVIVVMATEVGVIKQVPGGFVSYEPLRVSMCPSDQGRRVCVRDLDGANGPDIISACPKTDTEPLKVQCWMNDGDGEFSGAPVEFVCPHSSPSFPTEVSAALLDELAGPEVVLTASNRLYVLRYDAMSQALRAVTTATGADFAGDPTTFVSQCGSAFPSPNGPVAGEWDDHNGDGLDDGYFATFFGGAGFVPALGNRRLGPVQTFAVPSGSGQPGGISVGSLNADAHADVVLTFEGTDRMVVFDGSATGALSNPRTVFLGDGPVGAAILPPGPSGTAYALPSIAVGHRADEAIAVTVTDGAGGFFGLQRLDLSGFGAGARTVTPDLNDDGYADIVTQAGALVYRPNVASGSGLISTSGLSYNSLMSGQTRGLCAVARGPGAGAAKVATILAGNSLLVIAGLATPTSLTATDTASLSAFAPGVGVGSADLNGDGEPDIVTFHASANNTQSDLGVLLFQSAADEYGPSAAFNLPTVQRTALSIGPIPSGPVGQFRAGVVYDAGAGNDRLGIINLAPGPGNTIIVEEVANITLPAVAIAIAAADVNGDNILDIIALNSGGSALSAMLSSGPTTYQPPVSYTPALPAAMTALTLGRVNADTGPDLVLTTTGPANRNHRMAVIYNDGLGGFGAAPVIHLSGGAPAGVILADLHNPATERGAANPRLALPEVIMTCTAFLPDPPGLVIVPNIADPAFVPPPACPADFNADGIVSTPDLAFFLGRFGQLAAPGSDAARADFNADGVVSTPDLVFFIGRFGTACP